MILIVDTNRIIAGLLRDSTSRKILLNKKFEFYAPDYLLFEIQKHKKLILKKSKLPKSKFQIIFDLLIERINIVPKSEIQDFIKEANEIIGNIDIDDVPFIALALAIPNNGIWSDDKHLKKQNTVNILSTKDFINLIK